MLIYLISLLEWVQVHKLPVIIKIYTQGEFRFWLDGGKKKSSISGLFRCAEASEHSQRGRLSVHVCPIFSGTGGVQVLCLLKLVEKGDLLTQIRSDSISVSETREEVRWQIWQAEEQKLQVNLFFLNVREEFLKKTKSFCNQKVTQTVSQLAIQISTVLPFPCSTPAISFMKIGYVVFGSAWKQADW